MGEDLALRVYTSRLLGQDPSLVLHGGGNTSVKSRAREITGEPVEVPFVKGSGWDLASIEPEGFPACRLVPLRKTAELPELSDEQMVQALRSQMLDPSSPTPSVEALMHAWLPAKFVDHTHADAVLAVVDQPDGERHARAIWGDQLLFVPYVMPGFVLARRIVELDASRASVMVLDKHGIFTWGDTARESYERMIAAVGAAEDYVARARGPVVAVPESIGADERRRLHAELSPLLRGALARHEDGQRFVIEWRDEPEILALLERPDARAVTAIGTVTPDHVIRTKPIPAWLERDTTREQAESALAEYATRYAAYFDRCRTDRQREVTRLDRLPRLVLVPGLGAACIGKTRKDARIAGDIWAHTSAVIEAAQTFGSYQPVSELDLFDVEYWSLEQAKLKLAKGGGALERKIAWVTGAASGIGLATAELFLAQGAHVLLADRDAERVGAAAAELRMRYGLAVEAVACDVTNDADVTRAASHAARTFGGLDIVVSNAGTAPSGLLHTEEGDRALRESIDVNLLGHQRVARASAELLLEQGIGGCLLFNASKSAFNPGPEFGPYAIPKSGVVALMKQYAVDLGAFAVRANAINADRIRTDLFGGGVLEARAKARGISPDQYFRQNLLGRETTARDVAEAFAYLARAEATTGATLTVDGGNPAAFPR